MLSLAFSVLATATGVASGYLWYRASQIELTTSLPNLDRREDPGAILVSATAGIQHIALSDGRTGTWIDGVPQPTAGDIAQFINASGILNKRAAVATAMTSILSALATVMNYFSY